MNSLPLQSSGRRASRRAHHMDCAAPAETFRTLEPLEGRDLFAAAPVAPLLTHAQVDPATAVLTDMIVFGDSLSDTGDLFAMTGGAIPQSPYFDGRFSNGPLWVEQLSQSLGLNLTGANNWAVGGATSGFDNLADIPGVAEFPGMLDCIFEYAGAVGPGGADPDALYVVWAGANDFLGLTGFDPAAAQAVLVTAVGNIATAVSTLAGLGAQHILVPNLPDLGLIPRGLASGLSAPLTQLSLAFNGALDAALDQLALAGATTIRMDVFAWQHEVTADPAAFGLTDVATPYLLTGAGADPDGYLFFDDQHPTEKGHDLIADRAREALYATGLLPSLSLTSGQSVRYTDATGNLVTVKLQGPGSAEVRLLGSRSDAAQIILTGTTKASKLHITAPGGKKGGTTLYDLTVHGSLGQLNAPHVYIIGDVQATGTLGKMQTDDTPPRPPRSHAWSHGHNSSNDFDAASLLRRLPSLFSLMAS